MRNFFLYLCFFGVLFSACNQMPNSGEAAMDTELADMSGDPEPNGPDKIDTDSRKMIREGQVSFKTSDMAETTRLLTAAVHESKGYIAKEGTSIYGDRLESHMVIRVPADQFDPLLARISAQVDRFEHKHISALDVTEEFIDAEARVKTKKELQKRYHELLRQATKVDEMLNIEKELGTLQTEIESAEGRLRYLQDRVSFSTLNVTYYKEKTGAFGFSDRFLKAFGSGWNGFLLFLIGLVNLWVFILLAIVIWYIVRRWRRSGGAKRKTIDQTKSS